MLSPNPSRARVPIGIHAKWRNQIQNSVEKWVILVLTFLEIILFVFVHFKSVQTRQRGALRCKIKHLRNVSSNSTYNKLKHVTKKTSGYIARMFYLHKTSYNRVGLLKDRCISIFLLFIFFNFFVVFSYIRRFYVPGSRGRGGVAWTNVPLQSEWAS